MDQAPLIDSEIDPEIDSPSSSHEVDESYRNKKMVAIYIGIIFAFLFLIVSGVVYLKYPEVFVQVFSKSGFTAAFSLIFISEIGDKTFFIAALLAMKQSQLFVFLGTAAALALMTVISVIIGRLFSAMPSSLTSIPIGTILAVTLLVYFGIKSILEAFPPDFSFIKCFMCKKQEWKEEGENEELHDAEESLKKIELEKYTTPFQIFMEAFSLVFVAEWGDRSMLATIALAVAQSPVGVASGAIFGHVIATIIAVMGGAFISAYISERMIKLVGGILFLVFAVATALDLY